MLPSGEPFRKSYVVRCTDNTMCRNHYILKSSIPTSHEYVPPSSPAFKEKGTNFVGQHECKYLYRYLLIY